MNVPEPVAAVLAGRPEVGGAEQAIALLTVAPGVAAPDVCFLSRAQVEAEGDEVRVVLAGRTAPANLRASGRGTLTLVVGGEAHILKLDVAREASLPGLAGFALRLVEHRVDRFPIRVEPMRFTVTEDLPELEAWAETAELLAALRTLD